MLKSWICQDVLALRQTQQDQDPMWQQEWDPIWLQWRTTPGPYEVGSAKEVNWFHGQNTRRLQVGWNRFYLSLVSGLITRINWQHQGKSLPPTGHLLILGRVWFLWACHVWRPSTVVGGKHQYSICTPPMIDCSPRSCSAPLDPPPWLHTGSFQCQGPLCPLRYQLGSGPTWLWLVLFASRWVWILPLPPFQNCPSPLALSCAYFCPSLV